MAANVEIHDNASQAITSVNLGTINSGSFQQQKLSVTNVGNVEATSVQVYLSRTAANDGIDFALLAEDDGGNPGAFSTNVLNVGTLAPGGLHYFWIKAALSSGVTPAGNPRQFDIYAQYSGT